jgi:hypothetical protein
MAFLCASSRSRRRPDTGTNAAGNGNAAVCTFAGTSAQACAGHSATSRHKSSQPAARIEPDRAAHRTIGKYIPSAGPTPCCCHTKAGNCSASSLPAHIRSAAFRNHALSRPSSSLFWRGCL